METSFNKDTESLYNMVMNYGSVLSHETPNSTTILGYKHLYKGSDRSFSELRLDLILNRLEIRRHLARID